VSQAADADWRALFPHLHRQGDGNESGSELLCLQRLTMDGNSLNRIASNCVPVTLVWEA
jgi:hypothetical protein